MTKQQLTTFLTRYRKAKQNRKQNKFALELWSDDIRRIRYQLNRRINIDTRIPDKAGDGCTIIYADLFEFDGTKAEFLAYLWENHASRICSDYDCTGQTYTKDFRVAHHSGNFWKVCEVVGIDI